MVFGIRLAFSLELVNSEKYYKIIDLKVVSDNQKYRSILNCLPHNLTLLEGRNLIIIPHLCSISKLLDVSKMHHPNNDEIAFAPRKQFESHFHMSMLQKCKGLTLIYGVMKIISVSYLSIL